MKRYSAFSLLEVAIALTVSGIVLAGLIPMLTRARQNYERHLTAKRLSFAEKALSYYYSVNKALPCPNQSRDGKGIAPSQCSSPASQIGTLPYVSLGLTEKEVRNVKGVPFLYVMTPIKSGPLLKEKVVAQSPYYSAPKAPSATTAVFDLPIRVTLVEKGHAFEMPQPGSAGKVQALIIDEPSCKKALGSKSSVRKTAEKFVSLPSAGNQKHYRVVTSAKLNLLSPPL